MRLRFSWAARKRQRPPSSPRTRSGKKRRAPRSARSSKPFANGRTPERKRSNAQGSALEGPEKFRPFLFLQDVRHALRHEDHRVVAGRQLEEGPRRIVAVLRRELIERAGRRGRAVDKGFP